MPGQCHTAQIRPESRPTAQNGITLRISHTRKPRQPISSPIARAADATTPSVPIRITQNTTASIFVSPLTIWLEKSASVSAFGNPLPPRPSTQTGTYMTRP